MERDRALADLFYTLNSSRNYKAGVTDEAPGGKGGDWVSPRNSEPEEKSCKIEFGATPIPKIRAQLLPLRAAKLVGAGGTLTKTPPNQEDGIHT